MSRKVKMIAAGDLFITRRIAEDGYEGFEELCELIGTQLHRHFGGGCYLFIDIE